jgi:2'-5' RNA ligase
VVDAPQLATVVVALPSESDDVREFGPEDKHVTLLYFDKPADVEALCSAAERLATSLEPLEVNVIKRDELGRQGGPRAHVLLLEPGSEFDYTSLAGIQDALLNDSRVREMYEAQPQWPVFKPHVTLGYDDDVSDDDLDDVLSACRTVKFDRLAVWHGKRQEEFPLGANTTVEAITAGLRIVRTSEGAKRFGVPIGSQIRTDPNGNVVRVSKTSSEAPASRSRSAAERPDPNRTPTKYVPTVPGQKAKLPSLDSSGSAGSNGMSSSMVDALTDYSTIDSYIGHASPAAQAAIQKLNFQKDLTPADKVALCSMILQILQKMEAEANANGSKSKKSSSSSKQRTAKQKAATAKAQSASTKSTSTAKKKAQAKAQSAASLKSALMRTLRAAYKALGGDPKHLPADSSGSSSSSSSSSHSSASSPSSPSSSSSSSSSGPIIKPALAAPSSGSSASSGGKLPTTGFSGMTGEELTHSIRQLAMANRAHPSAQTQSALRKARVVRDRRRLAAAKHHFGEGK